MFCPNCGTAVPDGALHCLKCGNAIVAGGGPAPGAPGVAAGQTSGKAIASLILGFLFFFWPAAVAGIILGHLSLSEIRKSAGRLAGRGMAITGLVLSYTGLALIPLLIFAAILIPNLLRARIAANETSALGSIRSIAMAEVQYAADTAGGYTCSLDDLAAKGLITSDLARGVHGYRLELRNCTPESDSALNSSQSTANTKFQVLAYPTQQGKTGVRTFCADESGVIRSVSGSGEDCIESGSPLD